MSQKFRLSQLRIKSDTANRSGFVTENMTSATPDKAVGTTFKNVLVNETGEVVVGSGISVSITTPSVTGNTGGDFTSISMRGENDTGTLNTATTGVAQKVMQQTSVASGVATITTIVEEYVDNTLYVDLTYGNNTTALRERADRPFATVAAAVTASQANDTIVLRNGNYAMGTITLPHNLVFMADEGANFSTGTLVVGLGITLIYRGGTLTRGVTMISPFRISGNNSKILGYTNSFSHDGCPLVDYSAMAILDNAYFDFEIPLCDSGNNGNARFIIGGNAAATIVSNSFFRLKSRYIGKNNVRYRNNGQIDTLYVLETDTYDITQGSTNNICVGTVQNVSSRKSFSLKCKYLIANNTSQIINMFGSTYSYDGEIDIDTLDHTGGRIIYVTSGLDADIYCKGKQWRFNGPNVIASIMLANGLGNPSSAIRGTVGHIAVDEILHNYNTTKSVSPGYGTAFTVIGLLHGAGAKIYCKELTSLKNEVIAIDQDAPAAAVNIFTEKLEIYGTKLSRLGRDVGLGYDGVIYYDIGDGVQDHPDRNIDLYNGVIFINNGTDSIAIRGGGFISGIASLNVNLYDNVVWNGLSTVNTQTVNYLYQPTKTITASGTYTVLDSDNDLYYNLTLGNLTLVLPDPAKFVNREIQLKITALHATNTITVDPVGAALIDGAATYVIPGTSTKLVNIVFKSQNGAWRIK